MKYNIRGNEVQFEDDKLITLPFPIADMADVDEVLVVVLKLPLGQDMPENVWGLSEDGTVVWKIERIPETSVAQLSNQYVSIIGQIGDAVRIANWNGVVVDIDPQNGKVKQSYWGK